VTGTGTSAGATYVAVQRLSAHVICTLAQPFMSHTSVHGPMSQRRVMLLQVGGALPAAAGQSTSQGNTP
jgi:hypothetical protein